MSILIEEFQHLQAECKRRKWDCSRLMQLSAAIRMMKVMYKVNKYGVQMPYLTCYKSKTQHHVWQERHRENF